MLVYLLQEVMRRDDMRRRLLISMVGQVAPIADGHLLPSHASREQDRKAELLTSLSRDLLKRGIVVDRARSLTAPIEVPEGLAIGRVLNAPLIS